MSIFGLSSIKEQEWSETLFQIVIDEVQMITALYL